MMVLGLSLATLIAIGVGILLLIIFFFLLSKWYIIVPPSEAHLVVTPRKRMVCASHEGLRRNGGKSTYFRIPERLPFIGRSIRELDITIHELIINNQETYEKDQARYLVDSSTKYRITDVEEAAESFGTEDELKSQLREVIQAAVRAVTVKYSVTDVRANKKRMSEEIENEIADDLKHWGLKLISFQLVNFKDTPESKVISDISRRREVQINSDTRIDNANRKKEARVKEAESDEAAQDREIQRDEAVAKRKQGMKIQVAKEEQQAAEEEMKVKKIREVRQKEIEKEQSIIQSEAEREQRKISAMAEKESREIEAEGYKKKAVLEGEGNAAKRIQEAEAEAKAIEQKGLAEAKVKEELAKALAKYDKDAILAMTAEQIVAKDEAIGIEFAKAMQQAEIKLINAGEIDNMMDVFTTAKGGARLGAMFDSFKKTSGSNVGQGISSLINNLTGKDADDLNKLVENMDLENLNKLKELDENNNNQE